MVLSEGQQSYDLQEDDVIERHLSQQNDVKLHHLSENLMIADLLTKPLQGTLIFKFQHMLLGHSHE